MSNLLFKVLRQILSNQMIILERIPATDVTRIITRDLIKEINDALYENDVVGGNAALQSIAEQHREWKEEQEIQQSINEQMLEEADESELHKSRIDWKAGDVAIIKDNWEGAFQKLQVLGSAVFLQQWWVPVEDLEDPDPTFHKEAALKRIQ